MQALKHMLKRLNLFEKMLLVIGIAVTIIGFYYINQIYTGEGRLSWALLQAAFLWMVLLFMIILTDSSETVKEELKEVINQQVQETRLLRDISMEQLAELKIMNNTILGGKTQTMQVKKAKKKAR